MQAKWPLELAKVHEALLDRKQSVRLKRIAQLLSKAASMKAEVLFYEASSKILINTRRTGLIL